MSDGEVAHQQWTHRQVDDSARRAVQQWPYVIQEVYEHVSVTFLHYALDKSGSGFAPIVREPDSATLDGLFEQYHNDLIFYGHTHRPINLRGRSHYVNPGALGCHNEPVARYVVVECKNGAYKIQERAAAYDVERLYSAYEERHVPEREFIYRIFFGGLLPL